MKNMPLAFPPTYKIFILQEKKQTNSGLNNPEVHVSHRYELYRSERVWWLHSHRGSDSAALGHKTTA